jgi:hypothetical protein
VKRPPQLLLLARLPLQLRLLLFLLPSTPQKKKFVVPPVVTYAPKTGLKS